ncbi:DUF188 domain-containing protein [Bacillus songklensis]|uniref:UPF0178 protein ACFOU2_05320 n=1 Tax=Bacillus songklensis TaxID=1069116 RepID=A0ABV8AZ46_9BACI
MEGCRIESYTQRKFSIFVDADACPVKREILQLANTYGIHVIFVASYAHVQNKINGGEWRYVDMSREAVDLYIINHVREHDVVVTQDTGLASILVKQGVYTLSPRGKYFNEEDMDAILFFRYISAKERRAGHHSKGPNPFNEVERQRFITVMDKLLSKLAGI